jgi:hypothetical protein
MCVYLDPIVEEATIWSQKNCLAKLFICRKKIKERNPAQPLGALPAGLFREIIKYA